MKCKFCGKEIGVGSYVRYQDMPFCDCGCLGDYLVDQVEDEVDFNAYHSTPENDYLDAMEDRAAVRRDLAHEW